MSSVCFNSFHMCAMVILPNVVTLLLSSDICNTHVCLACCSCPACCLLLLPYQLLVTIASHCCLWWLPYFAACFLLLCLNVCLLLPCPVDCCFHTAVHAACCRCSVPVLVLSAICFVLCSSTFTITLTMVTCCCVIVLHIYCFNLPNMFYFAAP